ncbi:hypothetical protein [Infirmifilum sp.]|uniref:hypothetical protein n=1 Tax=Infirmifilum sp. TaxID=2856575 RepID=UPI003D0EC08A
MRVKDLDTLKTTSVIAIITLILLYPLAATTAQPVQSDKINKLIEILSKEVDRLQSFVKNKVTNTTKQEELLKQLDEVKALINNASSLASSGNYNESMKVLREVRVELIDIARKIVPEVFAERKHLVNKSIEAEIRALRNQINAMENVASRFQQKGVDTHNLTQLLSDAKNLLNQAEEKLKLNDTSAALQLVKQAWSEVKEAERSVFTLAHQLRLKNISEDATRLERIFNNTYNRLKGISPQAASEFQKWASDSIQRLKSLIANGRYGEALGLMRSLTYQYHEREIFMWHYAREEGLVQMAKQLALVIRPCNATLAEKLTATANQLSNALSSKDASKASAASSELRELIIQARFACRAKPRHKP